MSGAMIFGQQEKEFLTYTELFDLGAHLERGLRISLERSYSVVDEMLSRTL